MLRVRTHNILRNEKAFTLIEMMVVMSIIAIMMTLGAYTMISAREGAKLRDAAKQFQSDVRTMANNAITVEQDLDNGLPSKAWAIKVPGGGSSSYDIQSYTGDVGAISVSLDTVNLPVGVTINTANMPSVSAGSSVFIVFSSPFAETTVKNVVSVDNWESTDSKGIKPAGGYTGSTVRLYMQDSKNRIPIEITTSSGETSVLLDQMESL